MAILLLIAAGPRVLSAAPLTFTSTNSGNWHGTGSDYIWERSGTDHLLPTAGDTVNVCGYYENVFVTCNVSVATLNVRTGAYEGVLEIYPSATLTVDNSGTWSGGRIGGGGGTFVNRGALLMPVTDRTVVVGTMINSNLITRSGPGAFGTHAGALFYNATGAVFNLQSDAKMVHSTGGGGIPRFVNLPGSTFRKSAGAGTAQTEIPFDLYGALLDIQSGTFHIGSSGNSSGAVYQVSVGAVLDVTPFYEDHFWSGAHTGTGLGTIALHSNTISLSGTPVTFNFSSNLFHWWAGTFSCTHLDNKGFLTLDGDGVKSIKGYMVNSNRIEHAGAGNFDVYWLNGGFQNAAGAVYNFQGDGGVANDGTIDNYGTFRKSGGAGTSVVSGTFNNYGTIDVRSGTLNLRAVGNRPGTNYLVSPGATLDLSPQGDTTYSGTHSASGGGTVVLNGNGMQIAAANATFQFPTNTFLWRSGSIMNNILTNRGVIHLVGSGEKKVHHFVNQGWVLQEGTGYFGIHQNGYMINAAGAVFEIRTDAGLARQAQIPTFYNEASGTVRKVAGTGTCDFAAVFFNQGLLEAQAGMLLFSVTNTSFQSFIGQTGSVTRLAGGHLSSGRCDFDGGLLTGTGMLRGSVYNNSGIIAPGNPAGTFMDLRCFEQGPAGQLHMDLAGAAPGTGYDQLSITGYVYFGGTLRVSTTNGYDPAGHTYTLMTYGSLFGGRFDATNLPSLAAHPGLHWMVHYGSNALVIAPAAYYTLSSGAFTGSEASGWATVVVTRSSAEAGDLALAYSTFDGTARSGLDYTAVTGTVTLTGAQRTNAFAIPLVNNAFDALSERSFGVQVGPQGAQAYELSGLATAMVTIVDDDAPVAAAFPFTETFESGAFSNYWSLYLGGPAGSLVLTTNEEPHGARHVLMDNALTNAFALEELILTVNLAGQSEVWLSFYHKTINDEYHDMPDSFAQHTNADGVAVSADGVTWYTAQGLGGWNSLSLTHKQFIVSLDALRDRFGFGYNAAFKVKFQHYDNRPAPDAGFAFDDIRLFRPVGYVRFATTNFQLRESAGIFTVQVARAGAATAAVSCAYYADNRDLWIGRDFSGPTGQLSFAAGQTGASFTVTLIDDQVPEAIERGRFLLTDFLGCAPTSPSAARLVVEDNEATNVLDEGFDASVTPAGWTVRTNGGPGACWRFDRPGSWSNYTGGLDNYAMANSDFAGATDMDTELRTPAFDFSAFGSVHLTYRCYFYHWSDEVGDIDYSTNGAAGPWTPFWRYQNEDYEWVAQSINASALVAGRSNVMFRFHYYNAMNDWWWQLDEVDVYGETDIDHDGLPDWWETGVGGNPTNVDPSADGDHDAFLNSHEYRAGTDPGDSNSYMRVQSGSRSGPGIVIRWPSVEGRWYRLERSSNLVSDAGFGANIATDLEASPPENTATDTTAGASGPWIYRIEVQ